MNKTTEALKLAEKAANRAITTLEYFKTIGIHSDSIDPTIRAEKKALAAIREVLAQPVKQEPVGYQYLFKSPFGGEVWRDSDAMWNGNKPKASREIYAAPVDAKAIRAEALEEAAKVAESVVAKQSKHINDGKPFYANMYWEEIAAAIRGLK